MAQFLQRFTSSGFKKDRYSSREADNYDQIMNLAEVPKQGVYSKPSATVYPISTPFKTRFARFETLIYFKWLKHSVRNPYTWSTFSEQCSCGEQSHLGGSSMFWDISADHFWDTFMWRHTTSPWRHTPVFSNFWRQICVNFWAGEVGGDRPLICKIPG